MPLSRLSWCQRWPYTSVNQQNGKNRVVPRNFSWPVDRHLILVYSVGWTNTPICSYQRTIQMYNCIIIIIIPCYYRVYCIQYYWVQQNNKVIPHRLFLRLPHWNAGFDISSLCHLLWFRPLLSRTMQDPFKCYINISIIGFAPMGIKKGIFFLIWRSYTDSQILQIFIIIGSMYGVYIYIYDMCTIFIYIWFILMANVGKLYNRPMHPIWLDDPQIWHIKQPKSPSLFGFHRLARWAPSNHGWASGKWPTDHTTPLML